MNAPKGYTFPSLNDFESRLKPSNLAKVRRYLTQCIEGLQLEQAIWNLSSNIYKGMPLSNSIIIHELTEAEEFKKLGLDFFYASLEHAQHSEREKTREARQRAYKTHQVPHLSAIRSQFEYLSRYSEAQGQQFSPGILLRLSPFHSKEEVSRTFDAYPFLSPNQGEFKQAGRLVVSLLKEEPNYATWILEGLERGKPKSGIHLYDLFGDEIRKFAAQSH